MPALAYDETIRVPKLDLYIGPSRSLPSQFAPARSQRWPLLVLAVLVAIAAWTPLQLPRPTDRTVQAEQLLERLRG